jgi:hypothetical protein
MARHKKRSHSFKKSIISMSPIIGAVGYSIAEPFIDQMARKLNLNIADDYVKLGFGIIAPMVLKDKIVNEISKAALYISIGNITRGIVPRSVLSTSTNTSNGASFV